MSVLERTSLANAPKRGLSRRTLVASILAVLFAACGTPVPNTRSVDSSASVPSPTGATVGTATRPVPVESLNPDVRQETIAQTICTPGYTASVRPSTAYTNGVKARLLREQGIPSSESPAYALDHRIALSIGGHPRALVNLALQPWEGEDGAKKKDRLEKRLQTLVCSGQVLLDDARSAVYWDWRTAYRHYMPAR